MRLMIFGNYAAVQAYVRELKLTPSQWSHGSSRERVMGLDPTQFETVICGPRLDADGKAAIREWRLRTRMHSQSDAGAAKDG